MIDTLYGEVIDITRDEETGLSCITVKNNKGQTETGVSKLTVQELEALYSGKGYIQIPVTPMTK